MTGATPKTAATLYSATFPIKRRGLAEEIAPLVVYMASDACNFTTGQPVYLDGGLLAHP